MQLAWQFVKKKFQFHKGTIKTDKLDFFTFADDVSIP